jgi:hypothetical protein
MWKVGHNVDIKETAKEKQRKKRLSTYQNKKSDASRVLDPFRRKRGGGQKSQSELRKLVAEGKALRCQKCGKAYQRSHTICKGVLKDYGSSQGTKSQGKEISNLQETLKAAFEEGLAQKCDVCGLYYRKSHRCKRGNGDDRADEDEDEEDGERDEAEDSERSTKKRGRRGTEDGNNDDGDDDDGDDEGDDDDDDDASSMDDGDEDVVADMDEQDLLLRNLIIPSRNDLKNMRVDQREVESVTEAELLEVAVMSMYVALLLAELNTENAQEEHSEDPNGIEDIYQWPFYVFGPTLLLSFGERDANTMKSLFQDRFPGCMLFVVMTKAKNHYLVIEVGWFTQKAIVYDSLLSDAARNGRISAYDYCRKALDLDQLLVVFRSLQIPVDDIQWEFAEDMPQQNNGRDCGVFALEVGRIRVRRAMASPDKRGALDKEYQKLSCKRVRKYRNRIAAELQAKKVDINAKP